MVEFNPRDKSRTSAGKTRAMVRKHTAPPGGSDDGSLRWQWLTIQLLESPAFTTLSANACRAPSSASSLSTPPMPLLKTANLW